MIEYLSAHRLAAALLVSVGCLFVGIIEFGVTKNRTIAATTWFFGLLVLSIFTFGAVELGELRIWLAGIVFAVGGTGIVVFARKR